MSAVPARLSLSVTASPFCEPSSPAPSALAGRDSLAAPLASARNRREASAGHAWPSLPKPRLQVFHHFEGVAALNLHRIAHTRYLHAVVSRVPSFFLRNDDVILVSLRVRDDP